MRLSLNTGRKAMANLKQFAQRMKILGKRIEVNADKETITLAGLISQTVILATPVDTGRARGNWFASISTPKLKASFIATDPSGQARISGNSAIISQRGKNQPIFITNNLPYIQALNQGHSAQAPAAFVEIAIATASAHLKSVRLLKK